jgi:uncharacterized protein YutE (UPF0331/DUF86 family)
MPPTLQDRLQTLKNYLEELARLEHAPPPPGMERTVLFARERLIQVSVEYAADSGDLWLASRGHQGGNSAGHVFRLLAEHGAIGASLGDRLARHTTVRNRIVHAYGQDTPTAIEEAARALAPDLRELARRLADEDPRTS